MKVLITGASGFLGRYVAAELMSHGFETYLTDLNSGDVNFKGFSFKILGCDICDQNAIRGLVSEIKPEAIIHLAAISGVNEGQNSRENVMNVNVVGTVNLISASLRLGTPLSFVFASTAAVYGNSKKENNFYNELDFTDPINVYGSSKLAGEYIVKSFRSETFRPYITRSFNIVGQGQPYTFVCPAFADKVARAQDGDVILVGNIEAYRDFIRAEDIARAYRLILEKRPEQSTFVLGSGHLTKIKEIFDAFVSISKKNVIGEMDLKLVRKNEASKVGADPTLAREVLGWVPSLGTSEILPAIYQDACDRIQQTLGK